MAKLRPMERKRFTSPVAMLDALASNIAVIGEKLGVEISTGYSVIRFVPAFGESALSYTVTVDGVPFTSDSNGYASVYVEHGTEVNYEVSAEGYETVTGSLVAESINEEVHLARFVEAAAAGDDEAADAPADDEEKEEDKGPSKPVKPELSSYEVSVQVEPAEAAAVAEIQMNKQKVSKLVVEKGATVTIEVSAEGYVPVLISKPNIQAPETVVVNMEKKGPDSPDLEIG